MSLKISINSVISTNSRTESINGRDHIVTSMIPIVGDSVMNGGLYPDSAVTNSYEQLNGLLAPAGHPRVNGEKVSAYHPLAVNAFNIGGFVRNPQKIGKAVSCEFCLDLLVANTTNEGRELVRRINAKEKVEVSTGLYINNTIKTNGVTSDGQEYSWIGNDYKFDHVAILLNEKAAGSDVGTELKLNVRGEGQYGDLLIANQVINEVSVDALRDQLRALLDSQESTADWVFVEDILPDSMQVIYEVHSNTGGIMLFKQSYSIDTADIVSLGMDKKQVVKEISFIEVNGSGKATINEENHQMDDTEKKKKAAADEGKNKPTEEVIANEITFEQALAVVEAKGLVVNKKEDSDKMAKLLGNEQRISDLLAKDDQRLDLMRKEIMENTELKEDDLRIMGEAGLARLLKSIKPDSDYTLNVGNGAPRTDNSSDDENFRKEGYSPDYDGEKK